METINTTTSPPVDQATNDRVATAIDGADVGFRMSLIRLVDGIHTYELDIQGVVSQFVDNDEADATEQLYAHVRRVKQRRQAEAVFAALTLPPLDDVAASERRFCDFPKCDCSSGAFERCNHPPATDVSGLQWAEKPTRALLLNGRQIGSYGSGYAYLLGVIVGRPKDREAAKQLLWDAATAWLAPSSSALAASEGSIDE